ncbi:hypothetical protein [Cohnella luojiensis]|uniref:Uncharacterized protein n=1 Tax=Cohnella luojiensis TaxID=652876 RepID=A0A4Y8M3M7_9BACL|nr:hypothetical protein [Cohnella luojiensis]TFE30041.1 hypothetical protein E2980_04615 [Cohnella luojiensis]
MNKLKILPITITAALTAALLFGGWFAYRHYGVEQPLDRVANAIDGVESAQIEMSTEQVKVNLKLAPNADLGEIYRRIKEDGASEIGGKQLELSASAKVSPRLEKAWSYSLFDVAEAMENRKYSGIRDAMANLSKQFPGVTVTTDMDDENVYISMRDGDSAKFVVLPRQPAMLGVWPNA